MLQSKIYHFLLKLKGLVVNEVLRKPWLEKSLDLQISPCEGCFNKINFSQV